MNNNLADTVPIIAVDFHWNENNVKCYRTFLEISITQCITECLHRRKRCQLIRHNRHFRTCSLCEQSVLGYDAKLTFGDVWVDGSTNQKWFGLIHTACDSVLCQRTEKCVHGDCVYSECEWPSKVKGTLYPNSVQTSVGTKLRFDCLDTTFPECPIIRECQPNATWTETQIESVLVGTGNIALGKQANQSSTYTSKTLEELNLYPSADLAVDGNTNSSFRSGGSCSHTLGTTPAWWLVDLADVFWISRLVIYNRMESPWKLHDLNITTGVTLDNMLFCAYFEGPGTPENLVVDIDCGQTLYGRYVRIEKVTGGSALTLCEVMIFS